MTSLDLAALTAALTRFARREIDPTATVGDLVPMAGGHAGLTFGVRFDRSAGAAPVDLVLRLAPPGVRRQGNTDVFRQARLLTALHAAGLPVPAVPYADAGDDVLGTAFIMMERLPGRTFFIWRPEASFDLSASAVGPLWRQAAATLADLHRFDWRARLPDWETPRALADQVLRWDPVLAKSPNPAWCARGRALRDRLLSRLPDTLFLGVVHGDFQPGNLLFEDGRLVGIVDWELAGVADQMLDLGWLMMMGDAASWHASWRPVAPLDPATLAEAYADHSGRTLPALGWYRAWAGYSFGAISCMNLHLHRSARRVDPTWEQFALSIPSLFDRAEDMLR